MPTHVRAARRVHRRGMECEAVSISSSRTARRPIVSIVASVPESTSSFRQLDVAAAHDRRVKAEKLHLKISPITLAATEVHC